jgi:hypothetical protein
MNFQQLFAILVAAQTSLGVAASPVIGVASARGGIRVNQSSVTGNGTLFEGTTVETTGVASDVKLASGVRMQLAGGSKGTVYSDHTILERGESQLQVGGTPYRVDAGALKVLAEKPGTVGRIQIAPGNRVVVAAVHGNLRISTASGITVASLAAGRALEFDSSQAGASAPTTMAGCLTRVNGKLVITDEVSGITVEVRGAGVEKYVGSTVEINGTHIPAAMNPSGSVQTVQVTAAREVSKKCSSRAGAAAGAAGTAAGGAGAAAGTSAGAGGAAGASAAGAGIATKAVIAGVVVAAAATGAAVALTGQDEALSR